MHGKSVQPHVEISFPCGWTLYSSTLLSFGEYLKWSKETSFVGLSEDNYTAL